MCPENAVKPLSFYLPAAHCCCPVPECPRLCFLSYRHLNYDPSMKDAVKERTGEINLLHPHLQESWGASEERGCWSWFGHPMAWGHRAGRLPRFDTGDSPRDLVLLQTPFSALIKISKFAPVKLLEKIKSEDTLCCWGLGSRYFQTLLLGV